MCKADSLILIFCFLHQVCAETGRGYTYEQAFKLSHTFAANLRQKLKIQDGDTVMIMLPNVPDFPIVAMGILEAGGVISTINPVYKPRMYLIG